MSNQIIFIGGIHGSGKGTICSRICSEISIEHYSASDILKWDEESQDLQNKKVKDIPNTQIKLLRGLAGLVTNGKVLLDGHFCLLNSASEIETIPYTIFSKINPTAIGVVLDDPSHIVNRLKKRDSQNYPIDLLSRMQEVEYERAKEVSKLLKVPFCEIRHEITGIVNTIKKL
ncbi:adenylate kinase [Roseivirga pacifica]|uniref:Adenylate kinase n=1 Tax=Roseivirga pacifica TaxID=1267423 RepID=A0A1I0MF27_9BACT|nr:ATP-binding protein [Roseivirga pacifica]RKQ50343.1 adenylate kinase [Roseivirga pacifica]SEV86879.1 adenylate kinase [Roseivirga pacifica]